jgi:dihydropyrimidine dehydrogenase (NAD+) subunit PreA
MAADRIESAEDRADHETLYAYTNLQTRFCGIDFESPFVLAASPCTDEVEIVSRGLAMGWAGAVLKTTSVPGTAVDLAYPMMTSLDHADRRLVGMGNIDLISAYPVDVVARRVRLLKRRFPQKVIIASIMGSCREDWQSLVRRLESAGADMIECSFSCPQGSMGEDAGKMLAQSISATAKVAGWVKEAAKRIPVAIKITPQVTDIVAVARAIEDAGADAITAANSVPALMGVDVESFVPYPSLGRRSTYSGLTGPAIKPITLRTIAEISRHLRTPILGTGGASNWRDAVEFMLVGAGLVQFCTAVMHYGFRIIDDLKSGLSLYLTRKKLSRPDALIGKALSHIASHEDLPRRRVRSRVVASECIGCGLCYVACRDGGHQAIIWNEERRPQVDEQRCVGCGLCLTVRPVDGCLVLDAFEELV